MLSLDELAAIYRERGYNIPYDISYAEQLRIINSIMPLAPEHIYSKVPKTYVCTISSTFNGVKIDIVSRKIL